MNKVAVVFWSGTGNTEAMANEVVEGVVSAGGDISVFNADEFTADQVNGFDAIAFGCPSMGDEVLEEDTFEPMFTSCESKLAGKTIGLFGSYGWGGGEWMENWQKRCENAGAVLAAGSVICQDAPDEEAAKKCRELGSALS